MIPWIKHLYTLSNERISLFNHNELIFGQNTLSSVHLRWKKPNTREGIQFDAHCLSNSIMMAAEKTPPLHFFIPGFYIRDINPCRQPNQTGSAAILLSVVAVWGGVSRALACTKRRRTLKFALFLPHAFCLPGNFVCSRRCWHGCGSDFMWLAESPRCKK